MMMEYQNEYPSQSFDSNNATGQQGGQRRAVDQNDDVGGESGISVVGSRRNTTTILESEQRDVLKQLRKRLARQRRRERKRLKKELHAQIVARDAEWIQAKEARTAKMKYLSQVFPGIWYPQSKEENSEMIHRGLHSMPRTPLASERSCAAYHDDDDRIRQVDEIQLHLIAWKRVRGLQKLFKALKKANYSGWEQPIPLYIHTDGGASEEVMEKAKRFQWRHGPKYLDMRSENIGLRNMWLTSIGKAARDAGENNTLILVFEDDIQISSVYFQWLLKMIDRYAPNRSCRNADLVGFSLSPIVFQEIYYPFTPWDPDMEIQKNEYPLLNTTRHSAYLSTLPSSWGAAYWSDHWNRFDDFVKERTKPSHYNITAEQATIIVPADLTPSYFHIPNAAPNRWTKSWKRFMIDFMYAQGKVMLYPNLPGSKAFANARQDDGEHGFGWEKAKKSPYEAELVEVTDWLEWNGENPLLPPYHDLMAFGLDHKLYSRELLVALGTDHLNRIATTCKDCFDLLMSWARPGWTISSGSQEPYPTICVLDMYMSAASMAKRPISDAKTKFLIVDPLETGQERNATVMHAYVWSKILDRTLILPTEEDRTRLIKNWESIWSERDSYPTGIEDTHQEPILSDEFARENATAWRMVRISSRESFNVTGQYHTSLIDFMEIIDVRHLLDQALPVETIRHLFGGCDDHVLVIDGAYFGQQDILVSSKNSTS